MHLDLKIHPIALSGPVVTSVGDPKQKNKWPKSKKEKKQSGLFSFQMVTTTRQKRFWSFGFCFLVTNFVMKQANIKLLLCQNFRKVIIIGEWNMDMRLKISFDPIVYLDLLTVKSTLNASCLMQFYVMLTVKLWPHPTT